MRREGAGPTGGGITPSWDLIHVEERQEKHEVSQDESTSDGYPQQSEMLVDAEVRSDERSDRAKVN